MNQPSKREDSKPSRIFAKPSLINYEAVEKYIELFGTPVCLCCGFITTLPIFRLTRAGWVVYCLNCGITRDVCGTCMHDVEEDMSRRMLSSDKMLKKILDSDK